MDTIISPKRLAEQTMMMLMHCCHFHDANVEQLFKKQTI
jgi:hypothetical protein